HLVTEVPARVFRELRSPTSLRLWPRSLDVGLVQRDGLDEDLPATGERLRELLADFDRRAQREAEFLVEEGAGVVAGDIPAVAFAAAARAGVPSFGVGNFTWDWIYDAYAEADPVFAAASARFCEAYGRGTAL